MKENTPTTFYLSKKKYCWTFLVSALFVALGIWILQDPEGEPITRLAGWGGIIFFGMGLLISIYIICQPPIKVLSITDEGLLLFERPWKKTAQLFFPWKEILSFRSNTLNIPTGRWTAKQNYILIYITSKENIKQYQKTTNDQNMLEKNFRMNRLTKKLSKEEPSEQGHFILGESNVLNISHKELIKLLRAKLEQYQEKNSAR